VLRDNGAEERVSSVVDQLRLHDRNPLMHPEDVLERDDAIDLLTLCSTALNRITVDMAKRGFA